MILFERHFFYFFALLVAIIVPVIAIITGLNSILLILPLVFLSKYFLNIQGLFVVAIICSAIGIKSPIGRFMIHELIFIFSFIILFMQIAMHKANKVFSNGKLDLLVILFLINLFVIIFFRGIGMAIFGDEKVGGGTYIQWIVTLGIMFFSKYINLNNKTAILLVIGFSVLPVVNPILEWLTIKTSGSIYFFTQYFKINYAQMYQTIVENKLDTYRSGSSQIAALFQILGIFLLARKQSLFGFGICFGLGFAAILFSGFRSFLVAYVAVSMITASFIYRNKVLLLSLSAVVGILAFCIVIIFIESLPFSVQRALSFIPGLNIGTIAMQNATDTTIWRIEIWKLALDDFWNYALIGRGLAWDTAGWTNLFYSNWYASPTFFYANHNYHSGIVTLFIDYGLPGTVIWLYFQLLSIKQLFKNFHLALKNSPKSIICTFYIYSFIMICWDVFHFWVIYGQTATMMRFVIYVTMAKMLQSYIEKNYVNNENSLISHKKFIG